MNYAYVPITEDVFSVYMDMNPLALAIFIFRIIRVGVWCRRNVDNIFKTTILLPLSKYTLRY
jgi:hypothetical protein